MENETLDMKDDYTGTLCTVFENFLKSKIISNEKICMCIYSDF